MVKTTNKCTITTEVERDITIEEVCSGRIVSIHGEHATVEVLVDGNYYYCNAILDKDRKIDKFIE